MRWLATACASLAATPSTTVPLLCSGMVMASLCWISVVERGEQLAFADRADLGDIELGRVGSRQGVEGEVDRRHQPPRLVVRRPAGGAVVHVLLAGEQVVGPLPRARVPVVEVVHH